MLQECEDVFDIKFAGAEISRTICELLEWKRANGGLTMSAGNCWNDCRSKAGCDFRRCGVWARAVRAGCVETGVRRCVR
jgi:hypothetical protein